MKKQKEFDCVKMKWDIQKKIAREAVGISDKEFNTIQMNKIIENPILWEFIKKVSKVKRQK
jgi:hypothetical protein